MGVGGCSFSLVGKHCYLFHSEYSLFKMNQSNRKLYFTDTYQLFPLKWYQKTLNVTFQSTQKFEIWMHQLGQRWIFYNSYEKCESSWHLWVFLSSLPLHPTPQYWYLPAFYPPPPHTHTHTYTTPTLLQNLFNKHNQYVYDKVSLHVHFHSSVTGMEQQCHWYGTTNMKSLTRNNARQRTNHISYYSVMNMEQQTLSTHNHRPYYSVMNMEQQTLSTHNHRPYSSVMDME